MSGRSFLLDVAGGRRRIRVFEAGDGPPLVFLHGAGGLVEESPFLAALGRRWHVFAPLLPGYGDSEGGDTLPDMLAITLHSFDVIEALGLARPHLVGHFDGRYDRRRDGGSGAARCRAAWADRAGRTVA